MMDYNHFGVLLTVDFGRIQDSQISSISIYCIHLQNPSNNDYCDVLSNLHNDNVSWFRLDKFLISTLK